MELSGNLISLHALALLAMTKMAHSIKEKRTEQQAAAENLIRWHRFIINQHAQNQCPDWLKQH